MTELVFLIYTYVMAGVLGLCIGSFLNVVIYRVPLGMSVAFPASHCTSCNYKLKWYDNIPVLSYCILRGKCRKCGTHISARYTVVELANMALWLICVWRFYETNAYDITRMICAMVLCSVLICVFFIDLEHTIIPDRFQIIIAAIGMILTVCDALQNGEWLKHILGLALGGGFFLAVYYIAILVYKREGLGFGDVKLMAGAGLVLGWVNTFISVLLGSVAGAIILVLVRRFTKSEKDTEYPFAPFLTAGILLALLFGDMLSSWYIGLLHI